MFDCARLPQLSLFLLLLSATSRAAQPSDPVALQLVRSAVQSELHFTDSDHSTWTYRDHDRVPGKDATYTAIETERGDLRRMILLNGKPLSPQASQADLVRLQNFVNDPDAQAKKRRAAAHDGEQARELLRMLPTAFLWTIATQNAETATLDYHPNPDFTPPDMQSRVMGRMAGQMIIAKDGNRIRTLKGRLTEDITIGWGLLGRLYAGGTFDIERRPVGSGHWQITETHVHIGGHALLFKTIGQQEDEEKTDWRPSPAHNLNEALQTLSTSR
ncbi:MAG: hypothetical protein V4555_07070 [Acidobacteriota bacterium]